MALWKDIAASRKETTDQETVRPEPAPRAADSSRRGAEGKESVLGAGLTIEGTIEGTGHVRIAGRFHGDVHVQGDLTIEEGAKVVGGVRADTVVIRGELDGNIEGATRVDLQATGVLNGNLTAGSLTVAAGSRMRGQVEFGWTEPAAAPKRVVLAEERMAAS